METFNMKRYEEQFLYLMKEFNDAETFEQQHDWFKKINNHRFHYESARNESMIKYFGDFENNTYKEINTFFREVEGDYLSLVDRYYTSILRASFRQGFESIYGKHLFTLADMKKKTYRESVKEDIQRESDLITEYQEIVGNAMVEFNQNKIKLTSLSKYLTSPNRSIRKKAYTSKYQFYKQHEGDFDRILDKLIKVRQSIASKLGYSNFVQLGFDRMNRSHTSSDLKEYRKQVKHHGVPFVRILRKKQKERLGINELKYYDERVFDKYESVLLNDTKENLLENFQTMFTELCPETASFYKGLDLKKNLDLEYRSNKMGRAFATFIHPNISPYMFLTLRGVPNDVRLFAHESGHAFQFYMTRKWNIPEYVVPYDSAELFSFAMEHLTYPWMHLFFGEDTFNYQITHLTESFSYMPLSSAIDEFEHFLYEHPNVSNETRKSKWRDIERTFLPDRNFDGNEFLESGNSFYEIGHLFTTPFYFMDYDLAHFSAVQLWMKHQDDPSKSIESFLSMCRSGGSLPFHKLIQGADLTSPFEENSLQPLLARVQNYMDQSEVTK